jgi:hypothetical protein
MKTRTYPGLDGWIKIKRKKKKEGSIHKEKKATLVLASDSIFFFLIREYAAIARTKIPPPTPYTVKRARQDENILNVAQPFSNTDTFPVLNSQSSLNAS